MSSRELVFPIANSEDIEKGFGPIYRNILAIDGLKSNAIGVDTIYDLFKHGARNNPKELCLGKREIRDGKLDNYYTWKTYEEVEKLVINFANGLLQSGFVQEIPYSDHKTASDTNYKLIGIYSRNRMEWIIAEHAMFHVNACALPLYDTFGPEAIRGILIETGLATTICSAVEIKLLLTIVKEKNKSVLLKNIILVDPLPDDCITLLKETNINLVYFNDVLNLGSQTSFTPIPPKPLDPAFIFYTSGTTGMPKGVIILHQTMASVSQAGIAHHPVIVLKPGNFYLSYLPLPHVFEQFINGIILACGGAIGFYSGDKNLVLDDLKILRPTLFASVPRIFNRIKDKVLDNVQKSGGIKSWLFHRGINSKMANVKNNKCTHWLYDSLVFHKVRKLLGFDRLNIGVTGSAPISVDTLEFLKCLLCVPVVQGYGMTESAGGICCVWPSDVSTSDDCGIVVQNCEFRLISVPDMGYHVTDQYHGRVEENGRVIEEGARCYGRGEIVFRGYNKTPGYFRRPDLTKEAIDKDGWFHTGDVAMVTNQHKVRIIDRIKNILKLSQGEYVSVESLENFYQSSQYIDQIFVYGDGFQSYLVAIIVPDEASTKQWAQSRGLTETSLSSICTSEEFKNFLLNELEGIAKEKKLNGIEKIKNIYLESSPFSIDEGTLTPTMKLKRNDLKKKYIDIINQLYSVHIPGRS